MFIKRFKVQYINVKSVFVLFLCAVIASCASTSLTQSWKQPELEHTYKHPMIIGISDSQQTRRIYENYFVAGLKNRNITATPSHTLINSKQKINRETVVKAIQGTEIDSVLVTYLVAADSEMRHHDSPLNTGYSGSAETHMVSDTLVTTRGRSSSTEVIGLKNDLYSVESKSLVWSAQTKTVAPDSIDHAIIEVTELLIDELLSDNVLK